MPTQIEISAEEDAAFEVPSVPSVLSVPAVPSVPSATEPESLPHDLKASLALLQQTESLPTRNPAEEAIRAAKLNLIRAHVFRLQQGLPVIAIDPNELAKASARSAAILKAQRLELLARENPEIRELLAEVDRLRSASRL